MSTFTSGELKEGFDIVEISTEIVRVGEKGQGSSKNYHSMTV